MRASKRIKRLHKVHKSGNESMKSFACRILNGYRYLEFGIIAWNWIANKRRSCVPRGRQALVDAWKSSSDARIQRA